MRVTHNHISKALEALMQRRGLSYPMIGHVRYSDIQGNGTYRPSFYAIVNRDGGVTNVASLYRRATMRETLAHIETLS